MAVGKNDVVRTWLNQPKRMLIGGKWLDAKSKETFVTRDPSTGREICRVPLGSADDVENAVREAKKVAETGPWARMVPANQPFSGCSRE